MELFPRGRKTPCCESARCLTTVAEPLPTIELLPAKGIDFGAAAAYIRVGRIAVGAGGAIVNNCLIAAEDYSRVAQNAPRRGEIFFAADETAGCAREFY